MIRLLLAACAALAYLLGVAPEVRAQSQSSAVPCTGSKVYDASTNGATQLITAAESGGIYVCGYIVNSTAAVRVQFQYGTGTTCGTGTVNLTPAYQVSPVVSDPSPYFRGMYVPPGNNLCISTNAAQPVQAVVYYAQPR